MRNNLSYHCVVYLLFCTLLSCSPQDTHHQSVNIGLGIFNTLPKDSSFEFSCSNKQKTHIHEKANDQDVDIDNAVSSKLLYSMNRISDSVISIVVQFKEFVIDMKAPGQNIHITAADAQDSFDPSEKIMGAFNNSRIDILYKKGSGIQSVAGLDSIVSRMYTLANGNPKAITVIEGSIKKYLNDDFFRKTILNNLYLSERTMSQGDKWTDSSAIVLDMSLPIITQYVVKKVSDNKLFIEKKSEIKAANFQQNFQGNNAQVSLEGKEEGDLSIDGRTGIIMKSSSTVKAKGNISTANISLPIDFTISTSSQVD